MYKKLSKFLLQKMAISPHLISNFRTSGVLNFWNFSFKFDGMLANSIRYNILKSILDWIKIKIVMTNLVTHVRTCFSENRVYLIKTDCCILQRSQKFAQIQHGINKMNDSEESRLLLGSVTCFGKNLLDLQFMNFEVRRFDIFSSSVKYT